MKLITPNEITCVCKSTLSFKEINLILCNLTIVFAYHVVQFSRTKFASLYQCVSSKQLIYYIRLFFICQELFQNFFRSFWSRSFKNQTFLTAVSFETAYLLYQTEIRLSRTFFILFKPLFSLTAVPLSDSFNRIPQWEA